MNATGSRSPRRVVSAQTTGARVLAANAIVVLGSGCAAWDIETAIDDDLARVTAAVAERTGFAVAPRGRAFADAESSAELRLLLVAPLDEVAAVRVALLANRSLEGAYEDIGVARADLVRAGLLSNPVIHGDAKLFASGTEFELGLTQSLLDLVFLATRERVSASRLEAAKARLGATIVEVIAAVRRAHVDVRAAKRARELAEDVTDSATESRLLTERLYAAGNVTELALATARANEARARLDLARAELAGDEAREVLVALLGLWGDDAAAVEVTEAFTLPDLPGDLERVESRAVEASFELAVAAAHVDAHAQQAGVARLEAILPQFDAGGFAKKDAGDASFGLGPGGTIALPVFDQGDAEDAAAHARLRRSLADHWRIAVEVRGVARRLRARLVALCAVAEYEQSVYAPLEERVVEEVVRRYNAMQVGAFDVLAERRRELEAARAHVETLREAWHARIDLDALLAGAFAEPESLDGRSRAAERSDRGGPQH